MRLRLLADRRDGFVGWGRRHQRRRRGGVAGLGRRRFARRRGGAGLFIRYAVHRRSELVPGDLWRADSRWRRWWRRDGPRSRFDNGWRRHHNRCCLVKERVWRRRLRLGRQVRDGLLRDRLVWWWLLQGRLVWWWLLRGRLVWWWLLRDRLIRGRCRRGRRTSWVAVAGLDRRPPPPVVDEADPPDLHLVVQIGQQLLGVIPLRGRVSHSRAVPHRRTVAPVPGRAWAQGATARRARQGLVRSSCPGPGPAVRTGSRRGT